MRRSGCRRSWVGSRTRLTDRAAGFLRVGGSRRRRRVTTTFSSDSLPPPVADSAFSGTEGRPTLAAAACSSGSTLAARLVSEFGALLSLMQIVGHFLGLCRRAGESVVAGVPNVKPAVARLKLRHKRLPALVGR